MTTFILSPKPNGYLEKLASDAWYRPYSLDPRDLIMSVNPRRKVREGETAAPEVVRTLTAEEAKGNRVIYIADVGTTAPPEVVSNAAVVIYALRNDSHHEGVEFRSESAYAPPPDKTPRLCPHCRTTNQWYATTCERCERPM